MGVAALALDSSVIEGAVEAPVGRDCLGDRRVDVAPFRDIALDEDRVGAQVLHHLEGLVAALLDYVGQH